MKFDHIIIDGKPKIELTNPLTFDAPECGITVTVPAGFPSDGGSIPWAAQWFTGPPVLSPWLTCYVVHDYQCVKARESGKYSVRAVADAVLRHNLQVHGCPWWQRLPISWAVRVYGLILFRLFWWRVGK